MNNLRLVLFSSLTYYLPSLPRVNIIFLMILTSRGINYLENNFKLEALEIACIL